MTKNGEAIYNTRILRIMLMVHTLYIPNKKRRHKEIQPIFKNKKLYIELGVLERYMMCPGNCQLAVTSVHPPRSHPGEPSV